MRMLLNVTLPHEPFNSAVKNGTVGASIKRILEETRPEAVYFTEQQGHRAATLVLNVERAADIPALAEPWFLSFNADCRFSIAMTPQDLGEAGLQDLGKRWP